MHSPVVHFTPSLWIDFLVLLAYFAVIVGIGFSIGVAVKRSM